MFFLHSLVKEKGIGIQVELERCLVDIETTVFGKSSCSIMQKNEKQKGDLIVIWFVLFYKEDF